MEMLVGLIVLLLGTSRYIEGYSLDYEYVPHNDEQDVIASQARGAPSRHEYNANIQKCRCGGNEVWDGKGCSETPTYVAVMNPDVNQVTPAPTSAFRVVVGEVLCSQDRDVKVTLDPSKRFSNQFFLLPNGTLFWQGDPFENYCFDHTLDEKGEPTTWEAKVCLSPPFVPRCCNSAPASDGSCNTRSAQRYSPPIMVNELVLQWPGEVPEKNVNMKCKEHENLLPLTLNTRKANLEYESGNVALVWSSPNTQQNKQREEYCVEPEMEGDNYVAHVCYEDQLAIHQQRCSNATCVRKCCPKGEIMHETYCVSVGNNTEFQWVPAFTDANDLQSSTGPPEDLTWLNGFPEGDVFLLDPDTQEKDKFILLNNGSLFRPYLQVDYLPTQYCIDNFVDSEGKLYTRALVSFGEVSVDPVCNTIKDKVYPALLLVSSVFLCITLVVYISVPDLRDTLHGRCLISLVAALFVAYTLLATTNLAVDNINESLCSFLASVTHLSMLAAFFWLNVMCFDIWRTLRKTRTVYGGKVARQRFLLYSLYAWGLPLLIALMAVIMQHLPPSHDVIRPNFGAHCWFHDQAGPMWVYLYGWVLTLVVANIVFFSLVATIICKADNNPMLKRSREKNKERMWLYVKLFVVMGVTWVAEVVSWQVDACRVSIVTDVLNALQGVTIFIVFVCKRTTLNKVRKRHTGSRLTRYPLSTITSRISSISNSSIIRNRISNLSSSFKGSPPIKRSSASPESRARDAPAAVPLQTLPEAQDELTELSFSGSQETATTIPKRDNAMEAGTAEEATPLDTTTDSAPPSRPLETHFDD